jgi:hypothetical protein
MVEARPFGTIRKLPSGTKPADSRSPGSIPTRWPRCTRCSAPPSTRCGRRSSAVQPGAAQGTAVERTVERPLLTWALVAAPAAGIEPRFTALV